MKYVILIHSNPDPWGHPTQLYTPEGRALPQDRHEEMDRQFEALTRSRTPARSAPSSSTPTTTTNEGRITRGRRRLRRPGRAAPPRLQRLRRHAALGVSWTIACDT